MPRPNAKKSKGRTWGSNKNKADVSGLVVAAPELQEVSGTSVLYLEIRSRHYDWKNGRKVERYDYLDVAIYGKRAETLADELVEGRSVIEFSARLESRKHVLVVDGWTIYNTKKEEATYRAVTLVVKKIKSISTSSEKAAPAEDEQPVASEAKAEQPDAPQSDAPEVEATDAAKALAKAEKIDIAKVKGTGHEVDGVATVIKPDVEAHIKKAAEAAALEKEAGEVSAPAEQGS